jgi:DNA-directed RNA polymerase sigma subunit (sigma70/sigma32)
LRRSNLAHCLFKHFRSLSAGNQVPVVDDDRWHRIDTAAAVKILVRAHLRSVFVAAQNRLGTRAIEPNRLVSETLSPANGTAVYRFDCKAGVRYG